MRRTATLLAALGFAALGVAGAQPAAADDPGICVGRICTCINTTQCQSPLPSGDYCVDIDLDNDGDAETVCLNAATG